VDESKMQRVVGPGLACTTYKSKIIIEDVSHQTVFEGVLATIITGVVGGLLLGYLIEHIGFYLFSFFVCLLVPIVIALMGKRKVIIHASKKKVRRYTRLYLCMGDTQTIPLEAVQNAALRTKMHENGTTLSRVVLELDSGEDFEITLFLDSFGHDLKSGMVDKINAFIEALRRGTDIEQDENTEGEKEEGPEKEEEKKVDGREKEKEVMDV